MSLDDQLIRSINDLSVAGEALVQLYKKLAAQIVGLETRIKELERTAVRFNPDAPLTPTTLPSWRPATGAGEALSKSDNDRAMTFHTSMEAFTIKPGPRFVETMTNEDRLIYGKTIGEAERAAMHTKLDGWIDGVVKVTKERREAVDAFGKT